MLMQPSWWRRSKTIQNLPPALFMLMKSTEPWSDEVCMPFNCHSCCSFCMGSCLRLSFLGLQPDHLHLFGYHRVRADSAPCGAQYYQMDIEEAMREAGFLGVETAEADHRHRAVLGLAP